MNSLIENAIKRTLDILGSATVLVVTAPVNAAVAVAVFGSMGTPMIFRQKRPGKNGKVFELAKFRTMKQPSGSDFQPDRDRITPVGSFLRRTSLDELPTLWNVLKGEMSLVGPRPLLVQYLPRYNERQKRRHEVKPGVTGWAQINGRNSISWEEKFELDVWYVENKNLKIDLYILAKTFFKVLRKDGISHGQDVTMPEFMGSIDR